MSSPVGPLLLIGDENGLSRIQFATKERPHVVPENSEHNPDFFQKTIQQLTEYFQGKRQQFDIKLNPQGTDFQKKVWQQLQAIDYGETQSYADVADKVGGKNYTRAVGGANNKNPIPIIIPCHRVVGKNGSLVGFAGGIEVKSHLLELESY